MILPHDPDKQVNYLRHCLGQDKRPLGLFISAGCPLSLKLIPDIAGMTNTVCTAGEKSEHAKYFHTVFEHFKAKGGEDLNIENLLSHIRSLHRVVGSEGFLGLTSKNLEALDKYICDQIVGMTNKSLKGTSTPYHSVASWVGSNFRTDPVEIFTTNYDLLMEQALEECRVPFFDGFVGSKTPFFDTHSMEEDVLPARWARLWKLHGSINWIADHASGVTRSSSMSERDVRVIHPSHLKYDESRRMPYLAMMDRLRAFFKKPSAVIVICGYSFRDQHLNEVIQQGLQGNPTAMVFALLFGALKEYPKAISLASTRSNLNLLAEDAAVIGTRQAEWLCKEVSGKALSSPPVEWVSAAKGETEISIPKFKLGDFTRLGHFLNDLVGENSQESEKINV